MSAAPICPPYPLSPAERRSRLYAQIAWLLIAALSVAVNIGGLPARMARFQQLCGAPGCPDASLSLESIARLNQFRIHVGFYTQHFYLFELAFLAVWVAVGAIILWRSPRSQTPVTFLVATMLVTWGASYSTPSDGYTAIYGTWWPIAAAVGFAGSLSIQAVCYLFPTGRFVPRWGAVALALFAMLDGIAYFANQTPYAFAVWPVPLQVLVGGGLLLTCIVAPIQRYRQTTDPVQRQQSKWVFLGVTSAAAGFLLVQVLPTAFPFPTLGLALIGNSALYLVQLSIPIFIGFAMMRYRLWDVDQLINRTLVYGALTACVIGIHVVTVGYLGTLLQARGNLGVAMVGTGLVAILVQPLRERLQKGVNRLMYGDRDDPYALIARLGQRLEATVAPEQILNTLVQTVQESLRLRYTAITVRHGERSRLAAAAGSPTDRIITLPLTHHGELLGELILGQEQESDGFSTKDRQLLDDLARQAGVAVHSLLLTLDLQRSRERIITAREEERRRLRNDLHDGLGPAIAAQTLKLGIARDLIRSEPPAAEALLDELEGEIKATLAEIRRLVYDLRPPALDEWGLVGALERTAAPYRNARTPGLTVAVTAPPQLPPLPAAVEVAAYRIAQEALNNVLRHAQATACTIALQVSAGGLLLTVTDDGRGLSRHDHSGVGLTSMRERTAELGGRFEVDPLPGGGTRVSAWLPIPTTGEVASA